VPAVREATETETVRFCGAVPVVGATDSQGESEEAVKVSVPVPELETATVLALGFSPP
jgi:hypothetical protein